jgi:hypothetical protein
MRRKGCCALEKAAVCMMAFHLGSSAAWNVSYVVWRRCDE